MAQAAAVPVAEAEHIGVIERVGHGACECVLCATPHKVREGGGEYVVEGTCLPEPGTHPQEGIGDGGGGGQLSVKGCRVVRDVKAVGARWSRPLARLWET